jgi:NADH-quinone oxidoreductase E subunit
VAPYPEKRSGLLAALRVVQEERGGYLDRDAMRDVAAYFELHPMEVEEVVTFYTMFNTRPTGRYHLQLCRSITCFIMGSGAVCERLQSRLGIKPGETTADGLFTLTQVECLGACGTAPTMQVNENYHENLDPDSAERLISELT